MIHFSAFNVNYCSQGPSKPGNSVLAGERLTFQSRTTGCTVRTRCSLKLEKGFFFFVPLFILGEGPLEAIFLLILMMIANTDTMKVTGSLCS